MELVSLIRCLDFAAKKHSFQRRSDPEGSPYINHPIGVANILAVEGHITDLDVLQAAILHDTIEDTNTTYEELKQEFGDKVADMVLEVTDDKNQPKEIRKQLQIEHAKTISHGAKLIKLADKLYNLRDLNRVSPIGWTELRISDYFSWSARVVSGLRGTCKPLEEQLDLLLMEKGALV